MKNGEEQKEDVEGGRVKHVTTRFLNEVWIIFIVTIISSLAVLFGAAIRESVEKTVVGMVRWNVGSQVFDAPVKPIAFYWIYALFWLAVFVLVVILLRFIIS